ncbi:MAG: ATP synthase F1 subunit gamma [Bacillota bacterium]|nr:ATP synthase F1 subunit gamma [Bacillota bacterium]
MREQSEIKARIRTVAQTRKITKAMYMISTSKMKRALAMYESNSAYYGRVRAAIKDILLHSNDIKHPFLDKGEEDRAAYIVIAGDKGLAGSYNDDVCALALSGIKAKPQANIVTVGQEARVYFEKRGYMVDVEFLHVAQNPTLYNARNIAENIIEVYRQNIIDELYIAYTRFHSTTKREPRMVRLLPVELPDLAAVELEFEYTTEISYLPSRASVLDKLIPQYLIGYVFGALTHSFASEHSARMLAMESATNNAEDMLETLQLEYNRARQMAITQELQEIVAGTEALGGFQIKKIFSGNLR